MEQVQFYISMTSVLDCLDHSNNTYKFLKWVAFPFDVKWSAVCLPGLSEQDHWHYSCYTIYLKESLSFNVNPWAFVHDTPAVKKQSVRYNQWWRSWKSDPLPIDWEEIQASVWKFVISNATHTHTEPVTVQLSWLNCYGPDVSKGMIYRCPVTCSWMCYECVKYLVNLSLYHIFKIEKNLK